jgi:hypothetical protein
MKYHYVAGEIQSIFVSLDPWNVPSHRSFYLKASSKSHRKSAGIDFSGLYVAHEWEDSDKTVNYNNQTDNHSSGNMDPADSDSILVPVLSLDIVIVPVADECGLSITGCYAIDYGIGQRIAATPTDISGNPATGFNQDQDSFAGTEETPQGDMTGIKFCTDVSPFDSLAWTTGELPKTRPPNSRLIVDTNKLKHGIMWNVPIHRDQSVVPLTALEFLTNHTGFYELLFSNCDVDGRRILVGGELKWYNDDGYVPAEMTPFKWVFLAYLLSYMGLGSWYGYGMYSVGRETSVSIESTVLLVLLLGLLQMIFHLIDYVTWNTSGHRSFIWIYAAVIARYLKQAVTLSLILIVSIGKGVIIGIVLMGTLYIFLGVCLQLLYAKQYSNSDSMSKEMRAVGQVLTVTVFFIQFVFAVWILCSLQNTTKCLERWNQTGQLRLYLRFRTALYISLAAAVVLAILQTWEQFQSSSQSFVVLEQRTAALTLATNANYLFITAVVAILWYPNPESHEYAYVMGYPPDSPDDNDRDGVVRYRARPHDNDVAGHIELQVEPSRFYHSDENEIVIS